MNVVRININGVVYPCSPTMGAMLRFKNETGKEITEIDPTSLSELCTYLWCCVCSASKREGKPFDMPLLDFADSVSTEDMAAWSKAVIVETDADADKKKRKRDKHN